MIVLATFASEHFEAKYQENDYYQKISFKFNKNAV